MWRICCIGLFALHLHAVEDIAAQLNTRATAWYSAKPSERSADDGRALVDQLVLEHARLTPVNGEYPLDTSLNTVLMELVTEGPKSADAFVVNTCDHLLLRYGDDYIRFSAVFHVLYAEPSTLNFWPPEERKEHRVRRCQILKSIWSRINAGATDKLPPEQLPLLNIAQPSDPTLSPEERARAWDRYYQARDLNNQRAKHALRQADFQNAKDSCSESLETWLRSRCLPDDVGLMRDFLSNAGFTAAEITKMIGHQP